MSRDHQSVVLDKFNGLWKRGDPDNTPLDHFQDGENFKFVGTSSFRIPRDGVGIHQSVEIPLGNIVRLYNYPTMTANTILALTYDGITGNIYHVVDATTVYGPILTKVGMADFAFVPYAGRAYISPIGYFTQGDLNIEKGMQSEFLYVYAGDGTLARKAAGPTPAGTLTIANGAAGHTDAGVHVFGVVGETDTGYLSPPIALNNFTTSAAFSVSFTNIPVFSGSFWTKRHIVVTKVITNYNGNLTGYQLFFLPGATLNNNTATTLANQSFYDEDLLDDASHLLENYSEIPAGACLCIYHNRLCLATTYNDISIVLVSEEGEPEAINQIDGLIIVPPDGNPITNIQELRDVLYTFKRSKTVGFVDNGDVPSSWPLTFVDNALGCPLHGVATVLDSGASNVDFLITATYQGVNLFNGRFSLPELSWKMSEYWLAQDRDEFRKIQVLNAPIQNEILVVLPNGKLLVGDYANGMDPKKIRWTVWSFAFTVNAIAIVNIDEIILGAKEDAP
jgi:hypothetical protein